MIKIKPYVVRFFGILLFFVMMGCSQTHSKRGKWKNTQIDAEQRQDFHTMNAQLLSGLKSNKMDSLNLLMSSQMIKDGLTGRLVDLISENLKADTYSLLDEYYIVKYPLGDDSLTNSDRGLNNYTLHFADSTREMYIAFFVPKTGDNKYLLTACYNKFDFGWKLTELHSDQYTVNGMTAPELFEMAKAQYNKHYLVDAVNLMNMADKCIEPSDIWQYPVEKRMGDFHAEVISEANDKYKFPYVLTQVPTHPRIVRITNETTDEGPTYPKIYYLSGIKLADTAALRKENEEIKKIIGQVIPGIDKDKKYLLFAASNQMPDATREVPYFVVADRLQ